MSWKSLLMVFLGGGIGSILRFVIGQWLAGMSQKFPYGTLVANVIACLILGYLIGLTTKGLLSTELKLFLIVGVCGGFSTFSTFSAESFQLFNTGNGLYGVLYMAASFLVCLLAIYMGLQMGK